MRCRLILSISEHPIQQGIRKGGGPHFCDGQTDRQTDEDRRGQNGVFWAVGFWGIVKTTQGIIETIQGIVETIWGIIKTNRGIIEMIQEILRPSGEL